MKLVLTVFHIVEGTTQSKAALPKGVREWSDHVKESYEKFDAKWNGVVIESMTGLRKVLSKFSTARLNDSNTQR